MSASLSKGAFELHEPRSVNEKPKFTIRFLFNPEKVTRKVTPTQAEAQKGTSSGRQILKDVSLPTENITLNILLDASVLVEKGDQSQQGNTTVEQRGIMPILAAFQWLIYPLTTQGSESRKKANNVPKYDSPYIIFVWNNTIRLPVNITSISITEQEFGPNLMPIRAEVQISMDVITSDDTTLPKYISSTYDTTVQFRQQMVDLYRDQSSNLS